MIFRLMLIIIICNSQLLVTRSADVEGFDFLNIVQNLNKTQLQTFLQFHSSKTVCFSQLLVLGQALNVGEEWAIKMLDASAKPQSGVLWGNIMHVGNYDECLSIQSPNNIKGKYCSAFFLSHEKYGKEIAEWMSNFFMNGNTKIEEGHFTTDAKQSYGFCVPKTCTAKDLQFFFNYTENELQFPLHFHFEDVYCDAGDGLPFTMSAIVAIIIFGIFALIIICSTLYDILFYQNLNEKGPNLYVAFSMISNGKKLLSVKTAEDNLNCLNGLRVISMMWILLVHRFMYSFFVPQINISQIFEWRNATENAFLLGASMAVDTFFTIGGLLVVYLYMKNYKKGIKISLPMFYVHRILRLTPSLAMVVLLSTTLVKYIGSGPFWPVVEEMFQKPCERSWWSTLIYLQNYIHTHDQCVGQAWYLAVDTQMYFLSPFIIYPLIQWPKQTIGAILLFVILNCCYVFEITWKKHLGTIFFDQDDAQYAYIYSPTHVRGTVYLIGMVCGYFIFQTRSKPFKLCKLKVFYLWSFSLLVMLGIVLGHSYFIKYPDYNVLEASFFNSLTRVAWSLALSIIIILCVNGYGGLINSILSSKIFVVLIRLNYNIYLLHLLTILAVVAQQRTPGYFSNMVGFHYFWGDYAFSVAASVLWTLAFESPIIVLEKIIFGNKK